MTESVEQIWHMACPNCGDSLRIDISATTWVRLSPDGSDPYEAQNQDHEWNDASRAFCGTCGHHGNVASFTKAGGQP
jgi:hypothetical protein